MAVATNRNTFSLLSINSNGIKDATKRIVLRELLKNRDFLAMQETKIDSSFASSELGLPGWDIIRRDRNSHGGGLLIAARSNCKLSQFNVPDTPSEILVGMLSFVNRRVFVVNCYRPKSERFSLCSCFEFRPDCSCKLRN